jgi:hypothetical protein
MSKIPDPEVPASVSRSASNWASVGLSDPNSANPWDVKSAIAVAAVSMKDSLRTIYLLPWGTFVTANAPFLRKDKMPSMASASASIG